MPNDTSDNQTPGRILALSPNRKAIGAALVDGVGVVRTWLVRLNGAENEVLKKTHRWLKEVYATERPTVTVIEKLSAKQATKDNLALVGLFEAAAATFGCQHIRAIASAEALAAIQDKMTREGVGSRLRHPTLRQVAVWLSKECPEFVIHQPKHAATVSRDWERTWGLIVKAVALALYARDKHQSHHEFYAPSHFTPATPETTEDHGSAT